MQRVKLMPRITRVKIERVKVHASVPMNALPEETHPDLAARRVIIHAFLYYVLDAPLIEDNEYDRLARYVAKNWDELTPDRQWALGSPDQIRSSGSHIKYSSAAVGAALNYHKYATGEMLRNYPEDEWRVRRNGVHFVTNAAPRPEPFRL